MSENSVFLSLKENLSQGFNSITNALKGFNKNMEDSQKKAATARKEIDANNQTMVKYQRELHKAQEELKQIKKDAAAAGKAVDDKAFDEAQKKVNEYSAQVAAARDNVKQYTKELNAAEATIRRGGAPAGGGVSNKQLFMKAEYAQLAQMLGSSLGEAANAGISSAFGDDAGNMFGTVLSNTISGISIGAAAGGVPGAIGGAIVGLISGGISAATQIFEKKDEYFKNAVQESYEGFKQNREEMVSSGSSVAAGREVDELAFNKLLGDGIGTEYLEDLRDLAAHTPLEYDQLTEISRQLAIGFGDESDRMLELIEVVGDAGSAVGLDSSGMVTIATALSRMQSSDKVTLEYLNLIQERGIDAIGLIGQAKGLTTAQVYDAISKGTLDGSDVVDILQTGMGEKYGGAMQEQSQTYQGLSSTLSDQETERQNQVGEAYTDTRTQAMGMEIAFNDSEVGQKLSEIYAYEGELEGTAENLLNNYTNRAHEYLLTGKGSVQGWDTEIFGELEAYREEFLENEEIIANSSDPIAVAATKARQRDILDLTTTLAESQFEISEFSQSLKNIDQYFIDGLQAAKALGDTETAKQIGDNFGQGVAGGFDEHAEVISGKIANAVQLGISKGLEYFDIPASEWDGSGFAYGLDRVPYNGYLASLHEGERVLTAQQARQMDAAGGHAGGVVITGNNFTVREDADVTRIASELVRQIRAAQMVYAG